MVKTGSLSDLGLIGYRVVTPQTDRQTELPYLIRAHQYLSVQLSRVKKLKQYRAPSSKTLATTPHYLGQTRKSSMITHNNWRPSIIMPLINKTNNICEN